MELLIIHSTAGPSRNTPSGRQTLMAGLLTRVFIPLYLPNLGQWFPQGHFSLTVAGTVTVLAPNGYTSPYSLLIPVL